MIKDHIMENTSDHKSQKRAPPSIEEISKFREVQFLHHSNLFRMQIEELMSNLQIKKTTKVKLSAWFSELSTYLKDLPKSEQFPLDNYEWLEKKEIQVPLKGYEKLPKLNKTFRFVPPSDVAMIGSFPLDLASTHSKTIDVALVLPTEFMKNIDFYNGKWILKRALYLSWLGKSLQSKSDLISSLSWTYHCGSRARPVLQVAPSGKLGNAWTINLIPVPPEEYFKLNIISPIKSNISPSWYFEKDEQEATSPPPTPYHNWVCGVDLLMLQHFELIKSQLTYSSWIQGIKLLKIWLSLRDLNKGEGSISSHLLTLFVVYLTKSRKISSQMSPYQVFRTILLQICQSDWSENGPTLNEEIPMSAVNTKKKKKNSAVLTHEDFHSLYPVVFIDSSGLFNLAGNIDLEGYLQFRHECQLGLEILELSSSNSFDALFINRREFYAAFDQTIQITFDEDQIIKIYKKMEENQNTLIDRLGDVRLCVFSHVISLLRLGLEERVGLIGVFRAANESWSFGSDTPDFNRTLTLGFIVNSRKSTVLLTKGPSADSPEADRFREFWGGRSSLRRFKDSTFHEAILWMEKDYPVGDRRLILGQIVQAILNYHFELPGNKVRYVAGQLEDVLRIPYTFDNNYLYGTGEESISSAIISYDKLAKKLRSLDLPLKVTAVQSTSDIFQHSAVFPSLPFTAPKTFVQKNAKRLKVENAQLSGISGHCPHYKPSINVQLFLEISGKWPDDLIAIKSVKEEFLSKICHLLKQDGIKTFVHPSRLKVCWEGYVFCIEICYRREILLLRLADSEEDAEESSEKETEASIDLEIEIEILPKLILSINSLQTEFPNFSGAVRLIRRWVSSQLLLPHFPHRVIDLIVAYLFLNPFPYKPPNTPHVALLRFLSFMSQTDWRSTPVFVNLRQQFEENDETELTKRFTDNRTLYPSLFICSPCELRSLTNVTEPAAQDYDKRYRLASCWSRNEPSLPILSRMKVVAEAAFATFTKSLWKKNFDFKVLFRPPLDDYDALIYLIESELPRRYEVVHRNVNNPLIMASDIDEHKVPITDFDPVQFYLRELRTTFDNEALFFHDEHGGDVIGVLWKPHISDEKPPRMSNLEKHKVVGTNNVRLVTDVDAIIEEFKILGQDLVKSIKLKS